jgi:hypothetical protein
VLFVRQRACQCIYQPFRGEHFHDFVGAVGHGGLVFPSLGIFDCHEPDRAPSCVYFKIQTMDNANTERNTYTMKPMA